MQKIFISTLIVFLAGQIAFAQENVVLSGSKAGATYSLFAPFADPVCSNGTCSFAHVSVSCMYLEGMTLSCEISHVDQNGNVTMRSPTTDDANGFYQSASKLFTPVCNGSSGFTACKIMIEQMACSKSNSEASCTAVYQNN